MMSSIYILQSALNGRYYIGCADDVANRLREHNSGEVVSTRNKGPWHLVFEEKFGTLQEARCIESRLKRLKRRDYIERIVQEGYIALAK